MRRNQDFRKGDVVFDTVTMEVTEVISDSSVTTGSEVDIVPIKTPREWHTVSGCVDIDEKVQSLFHIGAITLDGNGELVGINRNYVIERDTAEITGVVLDEYFFDKLLLVATTDEEDLLALLLAMKEYAFTKENHIHSLEKHGSGAKTILSEFIKNIESGNVLRSGDAICLNG